METRRRLQLAGVLGTLVGAGVMGFGWANLREAHASLDWPTTTGLVERSWVQRNSTRRHGHRSVTYRARVEYRYAVGGATHRSERVTFGDAGVGFRAPVDAIVRRYPEGSQVRVSYAADRPWESLLVPGVTWWSAGPVAVGAGVALLSALLGVFAPRLARLGPGGENDEPETLKELPPQLFGGGPHRVEIAVRNSQPALLSARFARERWSETDGEWQTLGEIAVEQELGAGSHEFALRAPRGVAAEVELEIDEPSPGASLRGAVRVDGKRVWRDEALLDAPLERGYAFALEAELEELTPAG